MTTTPELSVVICTFNRCEVLTGTLESLVSRCAKDLSRVELLLIDNNSTDRTRLVFERYSPRIPNARYFFEQAQGLSIARNTGLANARASVIAFVDDDIFFDSAWIENACRASREMPNIECFAGRIHLLFESGRPDWLPSKYAAYFSGLDLGDDILPIVFPTIPIGANMIVRRSVFDRVGGFDAKLGRKGRDLRSNEEVQFFERAAEAGFRFVYLPGVAVYHRIPAARTTPEWLADRLYWQGVSNAEMNWRKECRGRVELVKEVVSTVRRVSRILLGPRLSLRRMYWHWKKVPFETRAEMSIQIGWAFRTLRLCLTSRK